jgi:hypothetical protein
MSQSDECKEGAVFHGETARYGGQAINMSQKQGLREGFLREGDAARPSLRTQQFTGDGF